MSISTLISVVLNCFIQNWLWIILGSIPLIYWYSTRNFNYWKKRGIDGPPAIPFLGNFFSFSIPFPLLYARYHAKYGKVFGVFRGTSPSLVVSDPAIIKRILVRDFALFRNRSSTQAEHRIFRKNLVSARDDDWKRIRSILSPLFTGKQLRRLERPISGCADSLIAWLDGVARRGHRFEARDPMGNFTMDVIGKCAFATETDAHRQQSAAIFDDKQSPQQHQQQQQQQQQQQEENVFIRNAKQLLSFNPIRLAFRMLAPNFAQRWMFDARVRPLHLDSFDFFETLTRHLIAERRAAGDSGSRHDMLQLMVNANADAADDRKNSGDEEEDLKVESEAINDSEDHHHQHHVTDDDDPDRREPENEAFDRDLRQIIGTKYLNEDEIIAQAMVFFIAGYETTAATLSYCMFEMASNPGLQHRLYREIQQAKAVDPKLSAETLNGIEYLDAVLRETLRKYPPALMLSREAAQDYPIPEYGVTLERGRSALIPIYALHHAPEYFPEPAKFDPERFMSADRPIVPYTYLPFGGGPRNCIGMRFALTEAKIGIARIIDRFVVSLADDCKTPLTIESGFVLLKTSPIRLRISVRDDVLPK